MKLSPSFSILLHVIWSGIFGLILSGGTAVFQYNTVHGINVEQDATLFALTMLTGLGSTLIATWHNIQASPALPVAEQEAETTIATGASQLAQSAHARIDQIIASLQSHMQEHAVVIQKTPTPSALSPVRLEPMPVQSMPVAATTPNTPPVDAVPLTTIPAMPVVQQ